MIYQRLKDGEAAIAVVGLGYVGLPVAMAFAKKFRVIGFDINRRRVEELRRGVDRTGEVSSEEFCAFFCRGGADSCG